MIISSIKLINFRQFVNTEIEFSKDKEKNITVLIGDNTSGKTTLVRAFLWCLYGNNNFDDHILLNKEILNSTEKGGEATVKVVIKLSHNETDYVIERRIDYFINQSLEAKEKSQKFKIIKYSENGDEQVVPMLKTQEEIDDILSPELKDYFFFDGESNTIDKVGTKKNLKDAVSKLMGIKMIEQLRDYYDDRKTDSVTNEFKSRLVATDSLELERLNREQNNFKDEIEKEKQENASRSEQIDQLSNQLNEIEELIDANKDVAIYQERKRKLSSDIEAIKAEKDRNFNSLISLINSQNSVLKMLFAKSFKSNELEEKLSRTSFSGKNSYKHISEKAIDDLIEKGVCLCGTKIVKGTDIFNNLISAKQHMEPRDYGKYVSDFLDSEKQNVVYSCDNGSNIINKAQSYIDCVEKLDQLKNALKNVESHLEGRSDVGALQGNAKKVRSQIDNIKGQMEYVNLNTIPSLDEKINSLDRKIRELTSGATENEFTEQCIAYCKSIYSMANEKILREKEANRARLEEVAGEIFNDMYHGHRTLKIDENFKADAVLEDNSVLDKSRGLETVKNFAFVTGIMQLIKEKMNSRNKDELDDDNSKDENYPLIMDAPFSNTDETHIDNICAALPKYCNQVIIVVMKKDFDSASRALVNKIGKKYKIVKLNNSEIISDVQEVC